MRRKECLFLSLAGLAFALAAAGCGGSTAVTAPEEASVSVRGAAVLQGAVVGAGFSGSAASASVHALAGGSGFRVSVAGTPLSTEVDEDGRFALAGVPAGTVNLRFEGPGVNAQVSVSGLVDGQVMSITVQVSGGNAQLSGTPTCSPTAETFFSGTLDQVAGTRLVVAGRTVDASQVQKVWRGERRIQLSDLEVGERVKVWGTLRGDGVMEALEIMAVTSSSGSGEEVWFTFAGRVESAGSGSYPTLVVKGITVLTNAQTKVKRSDGSPTSASEIKVGQAASVEGWKKTDGSVRATKIVVDGAGSGTGGTWVTFKGRVESVAALDAADVHRACVLKMTVAGRAVQTDGSTVFKWSDGSALDPYTIVTGDQAYVEGWSKTEGYVLATKVVVDKR